MSDSPDQPSKNLPVVHSSKGDEVETPLTLREIKVLERREKVKRLLARHTPVAEIARALDMSERAIRYDIAEIRKEAAEELARTSGVLDIAGNMDLRWNRRMRDYNLMLLQADEISDIKDKLTVKLMIQKQMATEETNRLTALQKLGVVQQVSKEIILDLKAAKALNSLPQNELDEATKAGPQALMAYLARALGDEMAAELVDAEDVTDLAEERLSSDTTAEEEFD